MPDVDEDSHFKKLVEIAAACVKAPQIFGPSEVDVAIYGEEQASALLLKTARAVLSGQGRTEAEPIVGVGIEGLYVFLRAGDLSVKVQASQAAPEGAFLDRMVVRGDSAEGSYEVVVYNLVGSTDES